MRPVAAIPGVTLKLFTCFFFFYFELEWVSGRILQFKLSRNRARHVSVTYRTSVFYVQIQTKTTAFKTKRWFCVLRLLFLWLQHVYCSNAWCSQHLVNDRPVALFALYAIQSVVSTMNRTENRDLVIFRLNFNKTLAESELKQTIFSKIFVWTVGYWWIPQSTGWPSTQYINLVSWFQIMTNIK